MQALRLAFSMVKAKRDEFETVDREECIGLGWIEFCIYGYR